MHPQNTYGTDLERVQLADIRFRLGYDWDIINPNAPTYSTAYHILEESTGDGVPYLTELEACTVSGRNVHTDSRCVWLLEAVLKYARGYPQHHPTSIASSGFLYAASR
jgi:hypothetical protein